MARGRLLVAAWRGLGHALTPAAPALIGWRRRRGKEHPARWPERLGRASLPRPEGPLVWLHGASVGETLALTPLVGALTGDGAAALVTSGTLTSAQMLATRLPAGAMHQFAPLDLPRVVDRFLDHWRPQALVLAESELWPTTLDSARRRGVPTLLVNARMSERSFARWSRLPAAIGALLARVDLVLARTDLDAGRFAALGARRVAVAGNLKYDVAPLPADPRELADLSARIGARPLWAACSTHEGEEAIALAAHVALASRFPDLLTIIAPRHPGRGPAIAELARSEGLAVARRAAGETIAGAQVYVADTIGELGLVYRLAGLAFVGGSLIPRGGQNPVEPARLGCAVLHGPHVTNFLEDYALLAAARGARQLADPEALAVTLVELIGQPARLRAMGRAAAEAVERQGGATQRIRAALAPALGRSDAGA